jgi:WD40 repeat protein
VWDSSSGEEKLSFSEYPTYIHHINWSPEGGRILNTKYAGGATIWDAKTGELLLDLFPAGYESFFADAAWTQDGQRVFLLGTDGVMNVFDSVTGEKLFQFTTPESLVASISLSPNAERVLIGGHEGGATVWDVDTGTEVLRYEVGGFVLAAYSPDGSRVMITNTEGDTGSVQIFPTWQSAEELIDYAKECCVLRELTAEERELFGLPPRED